MSRSTKAVLWSALVLPGAGQLYLKCSQRGIALIAASLVCLWVLVDEAVQQASSLLVKLESEGDVPDAGQVSDPVIQASNTSGSSVGTVATVVLACCWLFGIIDTYRLGKRCSEESA